MALTVRISPASDAIVDELVKKTGKSKIVIIEEALEAYRYKERMRLFNESYENLKSNKKEWDEELKSREELDGTLMDGIENE